MADTNFNNYEGRLSVFDDSGSWSPYEMPFSGLPRGHELIDGDLEHLYRHDNDAALYACRRGAAAWTSVNLDVGGIGSVYPDDLQRDENHLVAAVRPSTSTTPGNRILRLPLAECVLP
jgi:hypothetical protein